MSIVRRSRTPRTKVRSVMTPGIVATHPHESLADVAVRMRENRIGAVAIMDGAKLLGIITERDLTRAAADGLSPRVTPVSTYMTGEPFTIGPEEEVSEASAEMAARRIRHLPVVENGEVVGLLSARDILRVQDPCRDLAELAYEPW